MVQRLLCAWFVTTLGIVPGAAAETALRHDPFARPPLSAPVQPSSASLEEPWSPGLSAVVVAGKQSMVNLDGAIVTLGEEIDGHRLIAVNDQEAVFTKGKKRVVLKIQTSNLRLNKERAAQ